MMEPVAASQEHENVYPSPSDLNNLVTRVYNSIWDEYSSWSHENCQQTIGGLARPPSRPISRAKTTKSTRWPAELKLSAESCTITDYENVPSSSKRHFIPPLTTNIERSLRPYPLYNSCTSISQNLLVGDDSHYMPFIPFSDDPAYNSNDDIDIYHYFAWQRDVVGPDAQIISFETMRRLISEHGLTHVDIDKTGVLPLECEFLEKIGRKRDFPKWPPLSIKFQPQQNTPDDPDSIISYSLDYFCANLNCLTGFCALHDEASVQAQVPSSNPPKIPHIKASDVVEAPCGTDCFLQATSSSNSIGTFWTERETGILSAALRYAPDSLPCDLSIICRKPCREIHRYQLTHPPSIAPISRVKQSNYASSRSFETCHADIKGRVVLIQAATASRINRIVIPDVNAIKHALEDGKAAPARDQEEYVGRRNVHVLKHIQNVIQKYAYHAKQDHNSTLCRNVGLQRGNFKTTEVRESEWGLGLFVTEPCQEHDLVAEYIGEMIHDPTVTSRGPHAAYKGRSYVFNLNPLYTLDSAYAGNETRYMNHSDNPNCSTKVLLVNGQHRIGVYAARPIQEGEELFIDYGPAFWEPGKLGSTQPPEMPFVPSYDDPKDATYQP